MQKLEKLDSIETKLDNFVESVKPQLQSIKEEQGRIWEEVQKNPNSIKEDQPRNRRTERNSRRRPLQDSFEIGRSHRRRDSEKGH